MKKEDILEKSRNENKNKDLYEKDLDKHSGYIGAYAGMLLATVFFVVQTLVGGGMNYGAYAIAFSIHAAISMTKAVKTKRRFGIALCYVILTLILSIAHIYELLVNSAHFTG